VPLLGYMGSSLSALGWILSTSGLAYQHSVLASLGSDPGRGIFGTGVTIGFFGFVNVAAAYVIGLTDNLSSRDQALGILATTVMGTALSLLGGIVYTADAARNKRAWQRLGTF
jgi:hypothetical protein